MRTLVQRRPDEQTVPTPRPQEPVPELSNAALARRLQREVAEEQPITAPGVTGMQQWHERGLAHYNAGRFQKALEAFAEAYKLNPISTLLHDQATCLERMGRNDEAAAMYERYLANGPLTSDVAKIKARIRKLRGEMIPEGEDDDEPAIVAKGRDGAIAWFDRGQSAFMAKRYARAAECFRRAFALEPLAAFIYNEGSALEKGGHPAAAANAYEHYLIEDPEAKDAAEVIAKIQALRGQVPAKTEDSLMDPEDEASQAPGATSAHEWYDRGAVAYRLGDFKRAYDCFVHAYDHQPFPAFVYNQAAALDKLGNADAAVQAYERYLALDPKAKDAGKVRARIQRLREGPAGTEIKPPT
ncbi:tetratricopeptide repeat protein [Solirubrobacter soli]|uniref:tetratricopeptide repeat protein n=1 Tax=Solirubrobacter soli TaxID=363832 RepID=UPI00042A36AF|nr:tetratricopeptide repeat protein [Solirubrobacter soli]